MTATTRALNKLSPLMRRLRQGEFKLHDPWVLCLRSSLSKAFDFATFAHGRMRAEFAFHCMGGLRSISEDLIVLKGLMELNRRDRNKVFRNLSTVELDERIKAQAQFIPEFHAGQRVINRRVKASVLAKAEASMETVWKSYGYVLAKYADRPSTRQIAKQLGIRPLEVLYDFMFRVTSGNVHFNSLSLLGLGWGSTKSRFMFSPRNYGGYYLAFCRVYSVFLLTCYFELFQKQLKLTRIERQLVEDLRAALVREPVWPEMVTFAQMNQTTPGVHPLGVLNFVVLSEHYKKGFIRAYKRKLPRALQRSARTATNLFEQAMRELDKEKSARDEIR